MVRVKAITYRALGQDGAGPVAAVRGVRDVAVGVDLDDPSGLEGLLRLRLVGDTARATRKTLGKALLGGGDGEGRSGKEHLAEERGSEHDVK